MGFEDFEDNKGFEAEDIDLDSGATPSMGTSRTKASRKKGLKGTDSPVPQVSKRDRFGRRGGDEILGEGADMIAPEKPTRISTGGAGRAKTEEPSKPIMKSNSSFSYLFNGEDDTSSMHMNTTAERLAGLYMSGEESEADDAFSQAGTVMLSQMQRPVYNKAEEADDYANFEPTHSYTDLAEIERTKPSEEEKSSRFSKSKSGGDDKGESGGKGFFKKWGKGDKNADSDKNEASQNPSNSDSQNPNTQFMPEMMTGMANDPATALMQMQMMQNQMMNPQIPPNGMFPYDMGMGMYPQYMPYMGNPQMMNPQAMPPQMMPPYPMQQMPPAPVGYVYQAGYVPIEQLRSGRRPSPVRRRRQAPQARPAHRYDALPEREDVYNLPPIETAENPPLPSREQIDRMVRYNEDGRRKNEEMNLPEIIPEEYVFSNEYSDELENAAVTAAYSTPSFTPTATPPAAKPQETADRGANDTSHSRFKRRETQEGRQNAAPSYSVNPSPSYDPYSAQSPQSSQTPAQSESPRRSTPSMETGSRETGGSVQSEAAGGSSSRFSRRGGASANTPNSANPAQQAQGVPSQGVQQGGTPQSMPRGGQEGGSTPQFAPQSQRFAPRSPQGGTPQSTPQGLPSQGVQQSSTPQGNAPQGGTPQSMPRGGQHGDSTPQSAPQSAQSQRFAPRSPQGGTPQSTPQGVPSQGVQQSSTPQGNAPQGGRFKRR
ncbi:MAG: hypothetical protein LBL82_07895 [Oscillospiraceae bacterium]|jgi:hypothetical protein|nr:hypothetical protein [Oscillospiraceae bacterium]